MPLLQDFFMGVIIMCLTPNLVRLCYVMQSFKKSNQKNCPMNDIFFDEVSIFEKQQKQASFFF